MSSLTGTEASAARKATKEGESSEEEGQIMDDDDEDDLPVLAAR